MTFPRLAVPLLLLLVAPAAAQDRLAEIASAELGRRYDDALFRRAAGDDDPDVRRLAARAAGRLKSREAVAWLLPLVDDAHGRVRRSALFALGQIGDEAILHPLRAALPKLARHDRPHALEALGKTGDARAVSAVAAYVRASDPHARGQAALALFRLGDASAIPDLVSALAEEDDPEPRWRQVYALFRLLRGEAQRRGDPVPLDAGAQAHLRGSLAPDRMFPERVFAAMALGAVDGGESALAPLLRDEDPRVVVAAIRGLALGPVGRAGEEFDRTLTHADALVREAAVDAIVHWNDPERLRTALAALAREPRLALRAHVALARQGAPPAGGIELEPGNEVSEEFACRLAGATGRDLPDPARLRTPGGLRAAAEACGKDSRLEPEPARRALRALLAHEDATVRATAAAAVGERGFKDLAPELVEAARSARGPEAPDVRTEVANALGQLEVNDPWLAEAAGDPAHPVRDAARAALGKLGIAPPPERPRAGFRLGSDDAAAVVADAQALRGTRVVLETDRGAMTLVLLPDDAPAHCVNFARLVRKGFYDGLRWHRVVADFVIQGGCPRGDGWGGPGYYLPDEIGTRPYVRGTVGMPKAGDDTGGCQVFLTHLPTPHLDGRYTVFAQVVEGLAVIDRIRVGDRIVRARFVEPDVEPDGDPERDPDDDAE